MSVWITVIWSWSNLSLDICWSLTFQFSSKGVLYYLLRVGKVFFVNWCFVLVFTLFAIVLVSLWSAILHCPCYLNHSVTEKVLKETCVTLPDYCYLIGDGNQDWVWLSFSSLAVMSFINLTYSKFGAHHLFQKPLPWLYMMSPVTNSG